MEKLVFFIKKEKKENNQMMTALHFSYLEEQKETESLDSCRSPLNRLRKTSIGSRRW